MNQSHKIRLWVLLLFLPFTLSMPALAMMKSATGSSSETEERFKSPTTIRCYPPTLVTFRHEDEVIKSVANGTYGEAQVKRTLIKFQKAAECFFPPNKIRVYTTNDTSGRGYDFVMVDPSRQRIIFLEAKSTLLQTLFKKTKTFSNEVLYAQVGGGPEIGHNATDEITKGLEGLLRSKTHKNMDQLSRRWCADYVDNITLVSSSSAKGVATPPVESTGFLQKLINVERYKFMRVAALTIVSTEENAGPTPTTTYFVIVGDGDSEISKKVDPSAEDRIVNAGLTSFLLDKQEVPLGEAQQYMRHLYETLQGYRYPIEFIDYTGPLTMVCAGSVAPIDTSSFSSSGGVKSIEAAPSDLAPTRGRKRKSRSGDDQEEDGKAVQKTLETSHVEEEEETVDAIQFSIQDNAKELGIVGQNPSSVMDLRPGMVVISGITPMDTSSSSSSS
ncbi:MAG TPA: hypothetical protein DEP85_00300, partial [Holosporales bacterium]|nr:hypothetical protein [Holosporales bacterium]